MNPEIKNSEENWIQAFDPKENVWLPEKYKVTGTQALEEILERTKEAFALYKLKSGRERALFLEAIAEEIEYLGDELVQRCVRETGLGATRITNERNRTVSQLRLFASVLTEGSWVNARIDHAGGGESPPDIRQMQLPLGPVAVFEASNFPLAFSTAGGDTASALAAGCPVVVKSHSNHPGTSELVAKAIHRAIDRTGMPEGVFALIHGPGKEVGIQLACHSHIKAIGFTGSFQGGMALQKAAMNRPDPIPVYAEMGSINPVFILPHAARNSNRMIAEKLVNSIVLGAGQFCTNPGLILMTDNPDTQKIREYAHLQISSIRAETMLSPRIKSSFDQGVARALEVPGIHRVSRGIEGQGACQGMPHLLETTVDRLEEFEEQLTEEVFGPSSLMVAGQHDEDLLRMAEKLSGHLTITFFAEKEDHELMHRLLMILREKAGRIIYNGVPTGVEVCHAMVHGGPFPATTDSRTTSVGTLAIYRFTRPVCFQNFPQELLPDELRDENPDEINRLLNGQYSKLPIR